MNVDRDFRLLKHEKHEFAFVFLFMILKQDFLAIIEHHEQKKIIQVEEEVRV